MPPTRRSTFTLAAALASPALAAPAVAQPRFPDHPIRLIVPWTAGGSADAQFRTLAEISGRLLGQPVVVENRTGASGTMGAIAIKDARPDGYLVSQVHMGVYRTPFLQQRPAYDPLVDFSYIIQLTGSWIGIVVRADSPWRTLPELIDHARRNRGKLNYGALTTGSTQHLMMEQLGRLAGIEWTQVSYRGSADTMNALIAGQIDVLADSSVFVPFVEAGQARLLATCASVRAPRFPDVPRLRDLGFDYEADAAYGLCGPPGMPPALVATLHDAFRTALYDPAHLAVLERYLQPVLYLNSADYAAAARRYVEQEGAVLRRLGLAVN